MMDDVGSQVHNITTRTLDISQPGGVRLKAAAASRSHVGSNLLVPLSGLCIIAAPHSADYWPMQAACIHQCKADQYIKCIQCQVKWHASILRIPMHLQCPAAFPENQSMTAQFNPILLVRHCHFVAGGHRAGCALSPGPHAFLSPVLHAMNKSNNNTNPRRLHRDPMAGDAIGDHHLRSRQASQSRNITNPRLTAKPQPLQFATLLHPVPHLILAPIHESTFGSYTPGPPLISNNTTVHPYHDKLGPVCLVWSIPCPVKDPDKGATSAGGADGSAMSRNPPARNAPPLGGPATTHSSSSGAAAGSRSRASASACSWTRPRPRR